MSAVDDREAAPPRASPSRARLGSVVTLAVVLALGGTFVLGFLLGLDHEPSDFLHVDREISGTVVKVGAGGEAVVIDTDHGNESFQLLGEAPTPGDQVEGVVVELSSDGVSVEAVVLH
jgi:hypothetical protein